MKIGWDQGEWINPPVKLDEDSGHLLVTAAHESDFWRNTSYGFIHDSGHALVKDFPDGTAMEISFTLDYVGQFDQAGVIAYSDNEHWIKAGVESADGLPQVGAVVTAINSDWSLAPVPHWMGKEVTVRASREGNALTIRARKLPFPSHPSLSQVKRKMEALPIISIKDQPFPMALHWPQILLRPIEALGH